MKYAKRWFREAIHYLLTIWVLLIIVYVLLLLIIGQEKTESFFSRDFFREFSIISSLATILFATLHARRN